MRIKQKFITSTAINRNLHLSILLTSCIASIDCEGRAKDSGKLNRSDVFVVKDLAIQKVMKINSIQELGTCVKCVDQTKKHDILVFILV